MSGESRWAKIWKVNMRMLQATACGGIAWLFWQGYLAGELWCGLIAAAFAIGAIVHGAIGLGATVIMTASVFKWRRFKAKGSTPKDDKLATNKAMRSRGILG